jgi:hypothetical protein
MLPKIITGGLIALAGAAGFVFMTNAKLTEAQDALASAEKQVKSLTSQADGVSKAEANYTENFQRF